MNMTAFHGIFNDNGCKEPFTIFLQLNTLESYDTEIFSGNNKFDVVVYGNRCVIDGIEYHLNFKVFPSEILVIGREEPNWWHLWFPCFIQRRFFLASNRENV